MTNFKGYRFPPTKVTIRLFGGVLELKLHRNFYKFYKESIHYLLLRKYSYWLLKGMFCSFLEGDDVEQIKSSLPTPDKLAGFKMAPADFEKVRSLFCLSKK